MLDGLQERLQRLPEGWIVKRLGELQSVHIIGYGITRPGDHAENGVGMIRATDIQNGRLNSGHPRRITHQVHEANLRSQVQAGDIVVILVGRVGDAAIVTDEFHHWNTSRTVGIIRTADPEERAWLSLWLGSPEVRQWCERWATGSTLHRTLSLAALRDLPVPLPPVGPRGALLRVIQILEAKNVTNVHIADCATALSDARFAIETQESKGWPERPIGTLVELQAGAAPRLRPDKDGTRTEDVIPFAAPADVLQSDLPHLYRTERSLAAGDDVALCDPGSLLVASREDGVRVVRSEVLVAAGRGVLVLRPESAADSYWLLHEIRSRSTELAASAQGSAGRELSRRAFSSTKVRWPPEEVRKRFARLADRLHARVRIAQAENETLRDLRSRVLDGFLNGTIALKQTQRPLD
ncbi:hypothetical protein [Microbispora sp. NBRC 16548]|uniref:hypothetical protein n=1 Tax=Microbispora sp. NBRC 16548 TaxID=3030994 RepID=UPI0024A3325D|nr:hypothetical protein [Microbispora sp. NBRC 16548]GLX05697.1 hypothetical protein Misp03_26240 [Microbispora sp. NBRC 16548]